MQRNAARSGQDTAGLAQGYYGGGSGKITLFRIGGCPHCDRTGYKGRMGLYELPLADPAVKRLVRTHAPVHEIARAGIATGMRTLKQDGIEKVLQGLTDMPQARSV